MDMTNPPIEPMPVRILSLVFEMDADGRITGFASGPAVNATAGTERGMAEVVARLASGTTDWISAGSHQIARRASDGVQA